MKRIKNVPASVRQRLLYRLSLSSHLNRFVLKGALMLRVWDSPEIRPTLDTEDADYEGVRIRFHGSLEKAIIRMQMDIGFGDVVYPEPGMNTFPTLLDFPAPRLNCYSRESSIAEKLEAMVKLGVLNSRMKDFHDIWLLARLFDFDGITLTKAIRKTFERRRTQIPSEIEVFSTPFISRR